MTYMRTGYAGRQGLIVRSQQIFCGTGISHPLDCSLNIRKITLILSFFLARTCHNLVFWRAGVAPVLGIAVELAGSDETTIRCLGSPSGAALAGLQPAPGLTRPRRHRHRRRRRQAPWPATGSCACPPAPPIPDKDAALIVDGATGKVLYARNETPERHPASLTKMMTLYLLFDALKAGKVTMQTPMPVSAARRACRSPPS